MVAIVSMFYVSSIPIAYGIDHFQLHQTCFHRREGMGQLHLSACISLPRPGLSSSQLRYRHHLLILKATPRPR